MALYLYRSIIFTCYFFLHDILYVVGREIYPPKTDFKDEGRRLA